MVKPVLIKWVKIKLQIFSEKKEFGKALMDEKFKRFYLRGDATVVVYHFYFRL